MSGIWIYLNVLLISICYFWVDVFLILSTCVLFLSGILLFDSCVAFSNGIFDLTLNWDRIFLLGWVVDNVRLFVCCCAFCLFV